MKKLIVLPIIITLLTMGLKIEVGYNGNGVHEWHQYEVRLEGNELVRTHTWTRVIVHIP